MLPYLLIAVNFILLHTIIKSEHIHLLLKIIIAVCYIGWNATPYLLYLLNAVSDSQVDNDHIYRFYSNINQCYFSVLLFLFLYFVKKGKGNSLFRKPDFQYNRKFIISLAIVASVLVAINIVNNTVYSVSYWDKNNLENASASAGMVNLIFQLSSYILLTVVLFYQKILSRRLYYLCLLLLICNYLVITISGARINIFALVILLLYSALKNSNKKLIVVAFLIGIFAMGVLPTIGSLRGDSSVKASDIIEKSSTSQDRKSIAREIYVKTNSVNTSIPLIEHDGVGGGGAFVYLSTFYALVPRIIMPEKPQPGSKDGTYYGLPSRLTIIYSTQGSYNEISNAGVSSCIEVIWAIGWWGLALLVIIHCIILLVFNQILFGEKILFLLAFFSLINFPVCQIDVPLSTFLVAIQRFAALFIVLYMLFHKKYSHVA